MENILEAVENLRQAGLLAIHGTCCNYGEAVSCPAEDGHGPCECGYEEHNATVKKAAATLLLLLTSSRLWELKARIKELEETWVPRR